MGCCFSRPAPPHHVYDPNNPWTIGPGFHSGEHIAMSNMLRGLERQGHPVPTRDINGRPLRRIGRPVKEEVLAAAVTADPEFWLTPRGPDGQPLQGEERRMYDAMHQPVNPRPGMKRTVNAGGRVMYTGGYGLFGRLREDLHR